ncbi:hypothetical protein Q5P01_019213 [Channa striata]|uniref:Beta-2 adrenergic receptor n=1 Tax=Channa striata TaxID=64152 RepID=A0AA88SDG8_CHASR|nr:hypothetical protein Q5P01_019213 [Channa striata]
MKEDGKEMKEEGERDEKVAERRENARDTGRSLESMEFSTVPTLANQSQHSNSSLTSESSANSLEYSRPELILMGVAMAILVLAIVLGNVLVITAILRFQRLQTITSLFIASLAVADLIMGVFVVPFGSSYILLDRWQFGSFMCEFWTATDVMCVTASIETLCVIALDRYLAITLPLRYPVLLTRARAFVVVLGVWVVAFLISFLPIHLKLWVAHNEKPNNEAQKQLEKIRGQERYFYNLHCIGELAYPDDSPAMNKLRAGTEVREQAGEDRLNMQKVGSIGSIDKHEEEQGGDHRAKAEKGGGKYSKRLKFSLKEQKAVRTLGIIMGTFTLCWLPFFILNILMALLNLGGIKMHFKVLNWLGYCNSAFNPLIYSRSPDFRHAFQEILCLRGKAGSRERRREWGWCRDRDSFSNSPGKMNGNSDLNGMLHIKKKSRWKGRVDVPDSSLTLASPNSCFEKGLDVAPSSLIPSQAESSTNGSCKGSVASIA